MSGIAVTQSAKKVKKLKTMDHRTRLAICSKEIEEQRTTFDYIPLKHKLTIVAKMAVECSLTLADVDPEFMSFLTFRKEKKSDNKPKGHPL